MKANFDYSFQVKDQETKEPILGKNGKPIYKGVYTLSGTEAEIASYVDWRTSKGWQVKYSEAGRVQITARPPADLSKTKLYTVKSGDLTGKDGKTTFQYWIDFTDVSEALASIAAVDHYGDADFTSEFRRQTIADLRGASVSQVALSAVTQVMQSAPANLVDPIEE